MLQPSTATAATLSANAKTALMLLLEAVEYAEQTDLCEWQYAVEFFQFQALGVAANDLRFLMHSQYINHRQEVTTIESKHRTFKLAGFRITHQSCFVLNPRGLAAAHQAADHMPETFGIVGDVHREAHSIENVRASDAAARQPRWDGKLRRLLLGNTLVKEFKWQAVNQEAVLAAFEEEGWPARIDDPIAPRDCPVATPAVAKRRLSDAIKGLNRHQAVANVIRFHGDGSGEGVTWEILG